MGEWSDQVRITIFRVISVHVRDRDWAYGLAHTVSPAEVKVCSWSVEICPTSLCG